MKRLNMWFPAALGALLSVGVLLSCSVDKGKQPIGSALSGVADLTFVGSDTLYVSNSNYAQSIFANGSVSVLSSTNLLSMNAIWAVPTDPFNGRMAYLPSVVPDRLFVTNRYSDGDFDFTDRVYVLDVSDPEAPFVEAVMPVGDDPYGIDIIPAGDQVGWVLTPGLSGGYLNYFDGNDLQQPVGSIGLANRLSQGSGATAVAASPDGAWAAVSNSQSNVLQIIDLSGSDAFSVEAVLLLYYQGLFAPNSRDLLWLDNHRFLVVNRQHGKLFLIDLAVISDGAALPDDDVAEEIAIDVTSSPAALAIPLSPFSNALSLSRIGPEIWVTEYEYDQIRVLDAATLAFVDLFYSGGDGPVAAKLAPDGEHVVVGHQRSNSLTVINRQTREFLNFFP